MASYQVNPIEILDTTNSTGVGTGGSLTVGGGMSVGKNIYIGGNVNVSGTAVSFADNIIILNANPMTSQDTGILLQRSGNDNLVDNNYAGLIYSEVSDEFKFGYAMADTRGTLSLHSAVPINVGGVTITNGSLNASYQYHTIGNIYTVGGNVGIDKVDPNYKLEIQGSINVNGELYKNGSIFVGAENQWAIASTAGNLYYNDGSVGIGTSNPTFKLDVVGNARISTSLTAAALYSTNQTTTNAVFTNVSSSSYLGTNLNVSSITSSNINVSGTLTVVNITSTNLVETNISASTFVLSGAFRAPFNSSTLGSALFTTGGNVGINSTAPGTFKLDINGTMRASTSITTGGLFSTNQTTTNGVITNLSSTTIRGSSQTIGSIFVTGGNFRATFNSNTLGNLFTTGGNVGIGTGAPGTFRLNVNGTANISTGITTGTILSTNIRGTNQTITNILTESITSSSLYTNQSTMDNLHITTEFYSVSSTMGDVMLNTLTSVFGITSTSTNTIGNIYTDGAGNVGINVLTPLTTLDIDGTVQVTTSISTGELYSYNQTSANGVFTDISSGTLNLTDLTVSTISAGNIDVSGTLTVINITSTNVVETHITSTTLTLTGELNSSFDSVTLGNILYTTGGNVGIDKVDPSYKLDVNGSIRSSSLTVSSGGSYTSGSIYNDENWGMLFRSATEFPNYGHFSFANYDDFKLLTIISNGNIGINTSNPTTRLDVSGSARITTSLTTGSLFSANITSNNGVFTNLTSSSFQVINILNSNQTLSNLLVRNGGLSAIFNSNTLGSIFTTSGNVGIGKVDPGYQLELSSDSAAKPSTNTWTVSSDERLKTNIELADLDRCYNTIKSIPLKRYTWRDDVYTVEQVADRSKLGWIAQDVEQFIPKAVQQKNMLGYEDCRTLNSDQIIANLYGCVQKLILEVERLKNLNGGDDNVIKMSSSVSIRSSNIKPSNSKLPKTALKLSRALKMGRK